MRNLALKRVAMCMLATAALCAYSTTNYWDNNGSTAGFGTAGGSWGSEAKWSSDSTGTSAFTVINTTADDNLFFGTDTEGLAAGTVSVDGSDQAFKTMTFGAASGAITLAGGTLNLASPASSLVLNNTSNTINTVLTGASGIQVHTDNYRLTHKSYLTTTLEIIFTDAILADYRAASGVMGGSFIGANLTLQADAYHFVNDGTTVTFQLQIDDKDFIKCVKVELKQSGADITARAIYAKNISTATQSLGYNFDLGGNVTTVATSGAVKAYGAAEIELASYPRTLTLTGRNTFSGNTTISSGVLIIGESGQLGSGAYNGSMVNPKMFVYNSSLDQVLSGNISGSGALVMQSPTMISSEEYATLTLAGTNSYLGGTVINSGVLEATSTANALPSSGGIVINSGGELKLSVTTGMAASNPGGVGNGNPITVNRGGVLHLAKGFNAGLSRSITINGGTLTCTHIDGSDGGNYINSLTLKSGAQVTGNKLRVGYTTPALITVAGTNACSIPAGISMVKPKDTLDPLIFNVADVTGDNRADLIVQGDIRDFSTTYANMPVIKSGDGTLRFAGVNTHGGMITINGGTLALGGNSYLNANNSIVLSGGALDMDAHANKVGTLTLTADSTIVPGSGALAFADSSAIAWSGTLTVSGVLHRRGIRFGSSGSALTSAQLASITLNGREALLNKDGYLVGPPDGTLIILK